MIAVFLGPPGAGKGTQAKKLCDHFGFSHLSTGDLLRAEVKKGTTLGLEVANFLKSGALVPDNLVARLVAETLKELTAQYTGHILDGYPRNLNQAQTLVAELAKIHFQVNKIVLFELSEDILIERLSGRQVCSNCGASYHMLSLPSKKEGICDRCSGVLIARSDDSVDIIKNRLRDYEKQTLPVFDFFLSKTSSGSCDAFRIDAGQSPDAIFSKLLNFFQPTH